VQHLAADLAFCIAAKTAWKPSLRKLGFWPVRSCSAAPRIEQPLGLRYSFVSASVAQQQELRVQQRKAKRASAVSMTI
jgi:hypothetical protein